MFWIDKHNKHYRQQGHSIVSHFIAQHWNRESNKYINCTYSEFKRNEAFEKLLHKEQHGYCCYCMRQIEVRKHTTLEHVMPHNCKQKDGSTDYNMITYYKRFNKNFSHNVAYVHLNGACRKWHIGPPYPHFCAYENLVLSCDGSIYTQEDADKHISESQIHLCCNNRRGDARIVPLFFLKNIANIVLYNPDGSIGISPDILSPQTQRDYSDTIDALNLEHERLRIIRQVWYCIALSGIYTVADVKQAIKDNLARENIIADCAVPAKLSKRIDHDIYWKLLCSYHWFYYYFQKNILSQ